MKRFNRLKLLAVLISVFAVSACEKDDNNSHNNNDNKLSLKTQLESESRFSMMNEAVELAGKSEVFANADANIMLFAPPNDGFNSILAEHNASTVAELKAALGEERFTRFVMYHALEGNIDVNSVQDGNYTTMAEMLDRGNLTVFIEGDGNSRLKLNGGQDRGTFTQSLDAIAASNGTILELESAVRPQSNYDFIIDTEAHFNTSAFVQVMKNCDASLKNLLQDVDAETTVLLMQDAELEAVLAAYFKAILESDDIDNLLDASAEAALFAKYNVSTITELMVQMDFEDLKNEGGRSMDDIYAEMEADDNTELLSHVVFEGYEDFASQSGNEVTAKSFTSFSVNAISSTEVQLVDANGSTINLDSEMAHTASGAVYAVGSVQ